MPRPASVRPMRPVRAGAARTGRSELPELETDSADLRFVHDTMLCGLIVFTPDWQVVRMNPAAEAILGWRSAELRGRSVRSLLSATREDESPFRAGDGLASTALRSGVPLR